MKPKKRTYCPASGRAKIFFETKEEADRFITYNSEEILSQCRKAPVRSYYCAMCCGYHVTSNPSLEEGEELDAQVQEKLRRLEDEEERKRQIAELKEREVAEARAEVKSKFAALSSKYGTMIENLKNLMTRLLLGEAMTLILSEKETLRKAVDENPGWEKGKDQLQCMEELEAVLNEYQSIADNPEKRQEILSLEHKEGGAKTLYVMLSNSEQIAVIERCLSRLQEEELTGEEVIALSDAVVAATKQLEGGCISKIRKQYIARLGAVIGARGFVMEQGKRKTKVRPRTDKERLRIAKTIQLLELADQADREGNDVLSRNCMFQAISQLDGIPPCEEKDAILKYLGMTD